MSSPRPSSLLGFLALVGTIIGAGVFGVPLVFARMGIVMGSIVFWGAALLMMTAHLLFIEVIARDHARRRLPGYVGRVLGKSVGWVAVASHAFHLTGVNLAYLILGGQFLAVLLAPLSPGMTVLSWQIVFWVMGAISAFAGLRLIAKIEAVITWIFLTVLLIITMAAFVQSSVMPSLELGTFSWQGIGVFLFALSGVTIIPEVHELTNKRIRITRAIVMAASFATAMLIWLFGIGISMAANGRDLSSVTAIASVLPPSVAWLVPVFGLFAVASSFFITSYDLRAMYRYDLKLSVTLTWILAAGIPLGLLLFTTRDFFATIDIVGGVFNGFSIVLVSIAAWAVMRREKQAPPFWWRAIAPFLTAVAFALLMLQRLFR
ncbi:MAG: aromatic amino acid transport family protein [Patescibacteria group bacterium]